MSQRIQVLACKKIETKKGDEMTVIHVLMPERLDAKTGFNPPEAFFCAADVADVVTKAGLYEAEVCLAPFGKGAGLKNFRAVPNGSPAR